jgi:hypothetical protein
MSHSRPPFVLRFSLPFDSTAKGSKRRSPGGEDAGRSEMHGAAGGRDGGGGHTQLFDRSYI